MQAVIILRCELVCIVTLIFLLICSIVYNFKEDKYFIKICCIALIHVVFDAITVFTVNHTALIPKPLNFWLHICMYIFAVWFCFEIFWYVLKHLLNAKQVKKYVHIFRSPFYIYLLLIPWLDIQYITGRGTKYSMGSGAVLGYIIGFAYMVLTIVILLRNMHKLKKNMVCTLLPVTGFMVAALLLQVVVPELLFTGAGCTIVTVGLYFSIENPTAHFRKRALIDLDTGVKNKNCYEEDLKRLNEKYFQVDAKGNKQVACVVCDLNGLKKVNDNYGHIAGDEFIRAAAEVLSQNMQSASNVYRIGGDEFVALFIGTDTDKIQAEIRKTQAECEKYEHLKEPLKIAMGMASNTEQQYASIMDMISMADKRMYANKIEMKKNM